MNVHLIPNAHLDPVWLWDWQEGMTEAVTTFATVLDLMDRFPELTFIRGESALYAHVQKFAPEVFWRVRAMIEAGRWDVVGGTYVQPDTNLSATETLCRHFEVGLSYFEKELGVRPTVAWQADCFGHTAGWPQILQSFGMRDFAYFRPQRFIYPLASSAFWWKGAGKEAVLCYRPLRDSYCCERGTVLQAIESILAAAEQEPFENVAVFFGLGNHGGGPTARHLQEIEQWRASHPHLTVTYSTLHRFFTSLRREKIFSEKGAVPTISGEIGYCLRGVYSSAQQFKSAFRRAEDRVVQAEMTATLAATIGCGFAEQNLDGMWQSLLFNSFHDILPGTSIERAMRAQENEVRGVLHAADESLFATLTSLASKIDTQVPEPFAPDRPRRVPLLVWNASALPFQGHIELEVPLDYRLVVHRRDAATYGPVAFGLWNAEGTPLPFQEIETENTYVEGEVWRKRVVAPMTLPAFGWRVLHMGLAETFAVREPDGRDCWGSGDGCIGNDFLNLEVKGTRTVEILGNGVLLTELGLVLVEDREGSWGNMAEKSEGYCLDNILEEWLITARAVLESGPERARLWTRWEGHRSWAELTFSVERGSGQVWVEGRVLCNERSARLQWIVGGGGVAIADVPAGLVRREQPGQVPISRWFWRERPDGPVGFASDVLGDVDFREDESRVTLFRASRYASGGAAEAGERPWRHTMECGLLDFRAAFFFTAEEASCVSERLRRPPIVHPVSPHPGEWKSTGTMAHVHPPAVEVLSLKMDGDGMLALRLRNTGAEAVRPTFMLGDARYELAALQAGEIRSENIFLSPSPCPE